MEWLVKFFTEVVKAFFTEKTLPIWVKWLLLSGSFFLIELVHRSWILLWFGLGAVAAAVAAAILPNSTEIQILVFFLTSTLSLVLGRSIVHALFLRGTDVNRTNVHAFIGRDEVCVEDIDNRTATGAVKLFGTVWKAKSHSDDARIRAGQLIKIVAIDGLTLVVEPVSKEDLKPVSKEEPKMEGSIKTTESLAFEPASAYAQENEPAASKGVDDKRPDPVKD